MNYAAKTQGFSFHEIFSKKKTGQLTEPRTLLGVTFKKRYKMKKAYWHIK